MTTVSIRLPENQVKYLKKMTHYFSIEREAELIFVQNVGW